MGTLRERKLETAIWYFAKEHLKRTGKKLTQTMLFKYLAFLDFWSVKRIGKPAIGLGYDAFPYGPVPRNLYRKFQRVIKYKDYDFFRVIKEEAPSGKKITYIVPIEGKEGNLKFFSQFELNLMKELLEIFGDSSLTTRHFSEASHQKLLAWKKAWKKAEKLNRKRYPMRFEDEIENLGNNEEKKLLKERLEIYKLLMEEL